MRYNIPMKSLSLHLFQNSEFIILTLICTPILFLYYYFLKKTPSSTQKALTKRDQIHILFLTLLYGIISLWNLGSLSFPTSSWQPTSTPQSIYFSIHDTNPNFDELIVVSSEGNNNANLNDYQKGLEGLSILGSYDSQHWEVIKTFEKDSIYSYNSTKGNWDYPYIQIHSTNPNNCIAEIGFLNTKEKRYLETSLMDDFNQNTSYPSSLLFDEQDLLSIEPTYMDQSYFDEIYHPRNAWEIANGQYMYPSVHPLLGTSIIALFIKLFGFSPLIYRLPGALFGIFMVPLFYLILNKLFHKEHLSVLGTILFTFDFMHISTSRIATLEPFSIFFILLMFYFMLLYCSCDFYSTNHKQQWLYLFLSGLAMSIGIAVKWTACYSAVGLAILLFHNWFLRYKEFRLLSKEEEIDTQKETSPYTKIFPSYMFKTIVLCFLFFIFIPIIIYWLSYLPTPVWRDGYSIMKVWNHNLYMYKYHAELTATHSFQSDWTQWIFDIRPLWYYVLRNDTYVQTISCLSHPLLTLLGLPSILFVLYDAFMQKKKAAFFIFVGFFSAIAPWLFVSRCTFSYHFYPSSIFLPMAIVYTLNTIFLEENTAKYASKILIFIYLFIFILYLPITTGFSTNEAYVRILQLLKTWTFI